MSEKEGKVKSIKYECPKCLHVFSYTFWDGLIVSAIDDCRHSLTIQFIVTCPECRERFETEVIHS